MSVWNISKLAISRLSPKYLNGIIGAGLALLAIFRRHQGVAPILLPKNNLTANGPFCVFKPSSVAIFPSEKKTLLRCFVNREMGKLE